MVERPASSGQPLLAVEGVTVRFGGVVAVDDVSLSMSSGQVRGLIGPNGAGETTLFDSITGMSTPAAGSIRLQGEDITDNNPAVRDAYLG